MSQIKIYGADGCEDTQQTRRHLNHLGVRYDYVNIDFDPRASEFVKFQNGGKKVTPTVVIAGDVLVEPSDEEVDILLRQKALAPDTSRGNRAGK